MTDEPGFLLDVDRCTGCRACELACSTENALGWERSWRRVATVNEPRMPGLPTLHLSVACNHCRDAPCVTECPARALGRNPLTGAVLVDAAACIGCGYCGWVCPWDSPRFDGPGGVMDKCTMCDHRLVDGRDPACVVACPTAALRWEPPPRPAGDPGPPGFPVADVGPRIAFAPRRGPAGGPASTLGPRGETSLAAAGASAGGDRSRRVGLRSEASLWLFTTVLACLVGWMGAAALSGVTDAGVEVSAPAFLALLAAAGGVSVLHLGRRARAWRAVLNVRRSRLSREVVAFGAFTMASAGALAWSGPGAEMLRWVAAAVGLVATFLVDRVYEPVRPPAEVEPASRAHGAHGPPALPGGGGPARSGRWPPTVTLHSADTLLVAPSLAALLLGSLPVFLALATARAALALRSGAARADEAGTPGTPWRGPGWATVRLGVGLLVPALLLGASSGSSGPSLGWAAAAFLVGELLDRARFYEELRAPALGSTPRAAGPSRSLPATGRGVSAPLAGPPRSPDRARDGSCP